MVEGIPRDCCSEDKAGAQGLPRTWVGLRSLVRVPSRVPLRVFFPGSIRILPDHLVGLFCSVVWDIIRVTKCPCCKETRTNGFGVY